MNILFLRSFKPTTYLENYISYIHESLYKCYHNMENHGYFFCIPCFMAFLLLHFFSEGAAIHRRHAAQPSLL